MAFLEAMTIFSPGASSLLDSSDSFSKLSSSSLFFYKTLEAARVTLLVFPSPA